MNVIIVARGSPVGDTECCQYLMDAWISMLIASAANKNLCELIVGETRGDISGADHIHYLLLTWRHCCHHLIHCPIRIEQHGTVGRVVPRQADIDTPSRLVFGVSMVARAPRNFVGVLG